MPPVTMGDQGTISGEMRADLDVFDSWQLITSHTEGVTFLDLRLLS